MTEQQLSEDGAGIRVIRFIAQVKYSSPARFYSTVEFWKMHAKWNLNGAG